MKKTLLSLLTLLISSCASDEFSTNDAINNENDTLLGTWVLKSLNTTYDINTNEVLGVSTITSTIFISDSNSGLKLHRCTSYLNPFVEPLELIEEDGFLDYAQYPGEGYTISETKELIREYNYTYGNTRINYKETLTRSSVDIDTGRGMLSITGPLNNENQNHVCLEQTIWENEDVHRYRLSIPMDTGYIELTLDLNQPVTVSDYQYNEFSINQQTLLYFDVSSNSDLFINTVGSNTLSPSVADLTVTMSTANTIKGNYSFIGQDDGSYNGSFELAPY